MVVDPSAKTGGVTTCNSTFDVYWRFRAFRQVVYIDSEQIVSTVRSAFGFGRVFVDLDLAVEVPSVSSRIYDPNSRTSNERVDIHTSAEVECEKRNVEIAGEVDSFSLR